MDGRDIQAQRVTAVATDPDSTGLGRLLDLHGLNPHDQAMLGDLRWMLPMGYFPQPRAHPPLGDPTTWVPENAYHKPHAIAPMRMAPFDQSTGGVLFMDGDDSAERILGALDALRVRWDGHRYLAVLAESAAPSIDGYLVQMRLVPAHSARVFGVEQDYVPAQDLTWDEAVLAFVEDQRRAFKAGGGVWASPIELIDEDNLRAVAFGLAIENADWAVLREWSRVRAITK